MYEVWCMMPQVIQALEMSENVIYILGQAMTPFVYRLGRQVFNLERKFIP